MQDIIFSDVSGNKLLGTLSIPDVCKSVVIISHGFQSNKDSRFYVELEVGLNKAGIGTFRYDYYGHGPLYCKNSKYTVVKDVTLSKSVESLKAAIAFIRDKGSYDISLVGSSFGGLMSLIVASEDFKIKALALKSPVTEPISFWTNRLGRKRIERWKQEGMIHFNELGENFELNYDFWEDLKNYNTLKESSNIKCPVLIVHGGIDSVVPIKDCQQFAKVVQTNIDIIKGADHDYGNPLHYDEMKNLIIDFMIEKLSSVDSF